MGCYNQIPIYHSLVPEWVFDGEKHEVGIKETLLIKLVILHLISHTWCHKQLPHMLYLIVLSKILKHEDEKQNIYA